MAKLLIILCDTPFQSERVDHALSIAETALDKGHQVSFYLFIDGVYNIVKSQKGEAYRTRPISERFMDLIVRGAKVTCCRLCMDLRGLEEEMIPEGVITGGFSDLDDEIGEADAVLSFTG